MPLSWHPFPKPELYFYIFFKRSDFMNYIYLAIFYPESFPFLLRLMQ